MGSHSLLQGIFQTQALNLGLLRCRWILYCLSHQGRSTSFIMGNNNIFSMRYFWSLPRGVSPRLERGHARALSSPAVAAVSRFPSSGQGICGFPSRFSHEAFPRVFPTALSHLPPWCESILGLKVEAVQDKQVSLECTETSGGLWEWWHGPGVPLAFPVESASS